MALEVKQRATRAGGDPVDIGVMSLVGESGGEPGLSAASATMPERHRANRITASTCHRSLRKPAWPGRASAHSRPPCIASSIYGQRLLHKRLWNWPGNR